MHSFLSRANAVAAFALSVLACLTFFCFLSTLFNDYRTEASISTVKTIVYVFSYYQIIVLQSIVLISRFVLSYRKSISNYNSDRKPNDLGHITLDLKADILFSHSYVLSYL